MTQICASNSAQLVTRLEVGMEPRGAAKGVGSMIDDGTIYKLGRLGQCRCSDYKSPSRAVHTAKLKRYATILSDHRSNPT